MPLPRLRIRTGASLADVIYAELRDAILDGTLKPNERLAEQSIAVATKASRTPVREALHRLQADGLVQESGRGVVVGSITPTEFAEMCAVRETMEAMAASNGARFRSDMEAMSLRSLHDDLSRVAEARDIERLVSLNRAFHESIWQAGRNGYLARQLYNLRGQIERLQSTTLSAPGRAKQTVVEHAAILSAIERQDPVAAAEAAREHFKQAMSLRLARRSEAAARRT